MNKDGILVVKHSLAKKLLKEGFTIVDLVPKKNPDGTFDYSRSCYIFKEQDGLYDAINKLK